MRTYSSADTIKEANFCTSLMCVVIRIPGHAWIIFHTLDALSNFYSFIWIHALLTSINAIPNKTLLQSVGVQA